MTQIYRYEVPVDDRWHAHDLSGRVLHVDCRKLDVVEFWALASSGPPGIRYFRVFGTGQTIPGHAVYHGTADYGLFVWHLFETNDPKDN
ncbi:MAG TPA: hypothetical protein DGG94_11490 [Micromonosporaceae bacterium]|nr:hypothetical protein [Micromonosporaceae bacterium]